MKDFILELGQESKNLITLDALVAELDDYVNESRNYARAWRLLTLYQKELNEPLTLGDFIPCDSEGRPIERPARNRKAHSKDYHNQYTKSLQRYKEALKAVIFEGFTIDVPTMDSVCFIKNKAVILGFHFQKEEFRIELLGRNGGYITTRADLAEATRKNPLILKS